MDRLELLQSLIHQKKLHNYLEIGVKNGHIFFRLKSQFKVAVDPKFIFDTARRVGKILINPYNLSNQYFEKTSDDFFEKDAEYVFASTKLQIALINGMHEYHCALRDVENTLRYLSDEGVIIMHDCNPQSEQAAGRLKDWKEGVWNGDVWRTIIHLRSQRADLNVFVLDTDHGLGIITKRKSLGEPNPSILNFSVDQIQSMSYADFDRNRVNLLDIRPGRYAYEYFGIQSA